MKFGIYNLHQEKGVLLYGAKGVITAGFMRKAITSEEIALLINCNMLKGEKENKRGSDQSILYFIKICPEYHPLKPSLTFQLSIGQAGAQNRTQAQRKINGRYQLYVTDLKPKNAPDQTITNKKNGGSTRFDRILSK